MAPIEHVIEVFIKQQGEYLEKAKELILEYCQLLSKHFISSISEILSAYIFEPDSLMYISPLKFDQIAPEQDQSLVIHIGDAPEQSNEI